MIMAGKLVNVRITDDLFNELNGIVKEEGYKNIQELTKEMYREKAKEKKTLKLAAEFEEWRSEYVKKRGNKKMASKEELSEYIGKKYGLI
jgi:metal-responsive CopG/Arc/MetJ family transcriptional regulator